ncbi:deaminase [Streptomyces sp. NPDC047028]|uniref:deaminase n=1 Tax=Streptomyces sp. NPDC047028 TaxID=3155793 RepID=UPI0033E16754
MDQIIDHASNAPTPFAAALVDIHDGTIVTTASNTVHDGDPTAHAEINALRQAAADGHDLTQCLLVTTAECCPMCAAAVGWTHISGVAYGTSIPTLACLGIPQYPLRLREVLTAPVTAAPIEAGLRRAACDQLFTRWAAATLPPRRLGLPMTFGAGRTDGFRAVTPYLTATDSRALIAFYQEAFKARQLSLETNDGMVTHAEVLIGDSVLQIHDELEGLRGESPATLGGISVTFSLYTDHLDSVCQRALAAGAVVHTPPTDAPGWGCRFAWITDPGGHGWTLISRLHEPVRTLPKQPAHILGAESASVKPIGADRPLQGRSQADDIRPSTPPASTQP